MRTLCSPVQWGIIGVGDVCESKSGPVFNKIENSKLVAVCRRTPGKAREFAERHGIERWYEDANLLIHDEQVHAVYIATPPDSHLELGLRVANAGKPCLVEKPMARNAMEAVALAGAFERAGVRLYVAYYRRALQRYKLAKEWLPKVGQVKKVHCVVHKNKKEQGWRFMRTVAGGGLTVDIGSHCMDIIDWMFGPVLVNRAMAARRSSPPPEIRQSDIVEEYCTIHFALPLQKGQVQGIAEFDFKFNGPPADRIEVVGSAGTLTFAALGLYGSSPEVQFRPANGDRTHSITVENPKHVHQGLIQEIVHDLITGEETCSATAHAGVRTAVVIDAALEKSCSLPRLCTYSFRKGDSDHDFL